MNVAYTAFTAAKSPMSTRKIVVFTTSAKVAPAASSTAPRFLSARSAWASTPPSTRFAVAGSSLQADDYDGAVRMVVDRAREVVVGLTFVGQDTAELLHAATIAVVAEVPLARLWHAVPAYPTMSEVWLRLLEAYRAGS